MTAARYDPDTGSLYWRGTNERWVFHPRENMAAFLASFQTMEDMGVPGWAATCADFVRDLTAAIDAYDNDIQQEIAA